MKSLFFAVMLCGNLASASQSCFKADEFVWGLPQQICLQSVGYERTGVDSFVMKMTGEKINLVTEDYYMDEPDTHSMSAKFKFVEIYETCGNSLRSTLEAHFRMSGSEVTDFSRMWIEVSYEETSDSCHSGWRRGVVNYSYVNRK